MIIITGASDGLGLQLAKLYQEAGKKVINISRTESDFADYNFLCDLQNADEIKLTAEKINAINEQIEAVINCAGVMSVEPIGMVTESEVDRLLGTNVKAQILLVSELNDRIRKDNTDIVNVASTVGTKGRADQPVYTASKWAVRGFSKSLQEEFINSPNRVISFCTGAFKSRTYEKATGKSNDASFGSVMDPAYVAKFMKQILDLPKNMEVSEVIINRKAIK